MPLSTGQSLSFYEILGPLGAGGMGEVYRARDTRLDREVAIKVLPEELADDGERLMRFEREAKTLASLNHPNVAGIHNVDKEGDVCFLALELVPGEDLSERLSRGPLPFDEALDICRQIATGLDAAHEAGVVHRDLKPANVRITTSGVVKILDFGLAKAMHPRTSNSGTSTAQSDSFAMTVDGMILGTPTYMSPEQARGKPIDRRTDIWAFGCVLYECLTGKRAFDGGTFSDVTAAILKGEPDWSELDGRVSAQTARLLKRCLEKDPARRIRDIGDVGLEIDELLSSDPSGSAQEEKAGRSASGLRLAVVGVIGAVLGALLWRAMGGPAVDETHQDSQRMRLAIQVAVNQEVVTKENSLLAFSPDGNSIVFIGMDNGRQVLLRRALDDPLAIPIPGTEDGQAPFFSPDGRWIGFTKSNELMRVAAEGGRPFHIAESRGAGGAAWLEDGTIVFAPIYSDGLFRISADGGARERLTTPDRANGELGHWWPEPLAGGRYVLFTAFQTPVDRSRVGVLDLETGETRWVVEGGFFGRYVSTGHLLYCKGTRLYAVRFDAQSATATGAAVAVLDDLMVSQTNALVVATVSSRGTLAYVTASLGDPLRELSWLDRSGVASPAVEELRRYTTVSLSPDDRQAALTIQGESQDLWTYSFERGTLSRLTSGEDTEFDPKWSRDGRELFYVVDRPPFELHRITVGDPESGRPIWDETTELDTTSIAVAPDGDTIAYVLSEEGTGANLYARRLDGSGPPMLIRNGRSDEELPSFSPDGNWVVYQSAETGRIEIYVESYVGTGERAQVSSGGGVEPLWARNGEIFYRHDDELHVVSTRLGEHFEFDPPVQLLSIQLEHSSVTSRTYDVTADGQRVLVLSSPEASRPRQIEIVPDWTKELERLLPE
ncbi:MAG: Tol biopolymer transport system component [Chlamydiales bacterium]|jgi:Tol biopolymer transport system component